MPRCRVPDCPGVTEYEASAQAVLCVTCGTVATQDILTHEGDGELSAGTLYFGPTTLKSLRRIGSALNGQSSKEDKDRRNTVAIHQYINGLLTKLACPGLASRAQLLFNQAKVRGKYKWGKKAVLVAGACVAVVLRETKKGIVMSHLASLMDVSPHALCRVFMQINTLLVLRLPTYEPLSLLPCLQSHLKALISSPTCRLPPTIIRMLEPLPPAPVLRLATSLATLINGLDETPSPNTLAPPTACALYLLALEGQAASSLPSYSLLAQELGKKAGTRKDLVVSRYRDICKIVKEWIENVPWISGADHPDNSLGKKRRKASQRDVIAMGLKDVVQFQEDIKVRQGRDSKKAAIDEDGDWEHSTEFSQPIEESIHLVGRKRKRLETDPLMSPKFIRPTRSRTAWPLTRLDTASLSLLSPSHPLAPVKHANKQLIHPHEVDELQSCILTSQEFPSDVPPTRLQRLTAERGGEHEIDDEELFEEGELEGFFRSESEVYKLRDIFGWKEPELLAEPRKQPLGSPAKDTDWNLADMGMWADFGSDKGDRFEDSDVSEQILGEWRELSPSTGREAAMEDQFDLDGEW